MYIPKHFEVTDKEEIFSFIEANAFGQLISQVDGRPFCTHMPFLLSGDRTKLIGHLAAQNPQHLELGSQEVLVTLQGAHGYISPSWYSTSGVPTWNYQAVHIYGRSSVFNSPSELSSIVEALSQKYEAGFSSPWRVEYQESLLGAIVGIEINISEIQCKYKLSQNRSIIDQRQVVAQLKALGSNELAGVMERNEL